MVSEKGDNLIVDFLGEEVGSHTDEWDDGSSWMAALSPLRAEVPSGDYRLFYLDWLVAVEYGGVL